MDENGKIQHLNASITEDAGCSHNENILDFVAGSFKSCYDTDRFNLKTYAVRTDKNSNSYARAPGKILRSNFLFYIVCSFLKNFIN